MSRLTIEERDRLAADAQREQLQRRLTLEHEASLQENERRIIEALRSGGETSRQIVAKEDLASLNALGKGSWMPSAQVSVTWGTPLERAQAGISKAVRDAVRDTLQPFLDAAEVELKAADEERTRILETGRLS